jgi:hypothetical protein
VRLFLVTPLLGQIPRWVIADDPQLLKAKHPRIERDNVDWKAALVDGAGFEFRHMLV